MPTTAHSSHDFSLSSAPSSACDKVAQTMSEIGFLEKTRRGCLVAARGGVGVLGKKWVWKGREEGLEMERNKSSVDSVNCNYINHMNPTVNRIGPLRTS